MAFPTGMASCISNTGSTGLFGKTTRGEGMYVKPPLEEVAFEPAGGEEAFGRGAFEDTCPPNTNPDI